MEDKQMELKSGWELWLAPDGERDLTDLSDAPDSRIPASVPGDWPLDAVRAGWLEEPFFRKRQLPVVWQQRPAHEILSQETLRILKNS